MERQKYVFAMGGTTIDNYYMVDNWIQLGDKISCQFVERILGGPQLNMSSVLAGYGDKVYFMDAIPRNADGEFVMQSLAERGVDTSCVVRQENCKNSEGILFVSKREGDRAIFLEQSYCDPIEPSGQMLERIENATYFYTMNRYIGDVLRSTDCIKRARAAGCKLVIDGEGHYEDQSNLELLHMADIVLINDTSYGRLKACIGADPAASLLADAAQVVVMTKGPDGCEVFTREEHFAAPGIPVKAIDTTGAGDTFAASFLHCLLQGKDLRYAATFANGAAARLCTILGGGGGIAPEEEVLAFIRDHGVVL
ncbi:Uncharacterized sugar kinase ydjH [Anaerotruncus sp. 2789STDY5834896]|uniref:Uncharacterized sugar kinase ydjH n=1 Tax=uncultured Anaerotruncus sp. TaxID=905011 RepID=A0A1C6HRB1_9FIRM|nr:Uncharacterized sugar kinase ydjH [uncultured Anaerotruncus sp.]